MENTSKILICDENADERKKLREGLVSAGYRFIDEVSAGDDALEKLKINEYDMAIIDLWVSGLDGIGIIRMAEKQN